jgi:hypothetical protein
MIILVSGATRTVERFRDQLGRLVTPRGGNSIDGIAGGGQLWAADNDAFGAWDEGRFRKMLDRISRVDRSRFLWVALPDVVGNARETIDRWGEWYPQVVRLGVPAAFVGQDGLSGEEGRIPWDEMAAFFVGGSTEWKLGEEAERFVGEARRRGKWTHIGRVNTEKRIRHAVEIGADSIDGTTFSRWPDRWIPRGLAWIRRSKQQMHFLGPRRA